MNRNDDEDDENTPLVRYSRLVGRILGIILTGLLVVWLLGQAGALNGDRPENTGQVERQNQGNDSK